MGIDSIARAVQMWRNKGVALNPAASQSSMDRLSRCLETKVPLELAKFYELANGMKDYATDGWNLSFWSIERVVREQDLQNDAIAIADFFSNSHCIRLKCDADALEVLVDGTDDRFPSLESFFRAYLHTPDRFGMEEGATAKLL
jgi:hypothetical protein